MAQINQTSGSDNNEFSLVTHFKGYVSDIDPTNASPEILVQGSQNVYKKNSGTISVRPGRKLYDASTDATLAGVKSGTIWNTSLAATIPLRVANSKLQFYSTISGSGVWYDLMTSLSLTRFVFDSWWNNTDKKDLLVFVKGDTNLHAWSGGVGLFVSAINNTSITLDRNTATAGFASTGSVTINGTSYTYTGLSGSTLTGVTGDASAQAVNTVSYSTVITNATTPASTNTNDFIRVINNQVYVGSYTSRLIYISKRTDYTSYTQSTPRLTGEGELLTLDDVGKGIGVRQGLAHIFAGTSNVYAVSFSQITVGAVLSEQSNVNKVQLGNLQAAQGHEFIDVYGDNIVFLDQANQLRVFGSFRNQFTDKAPMLSSQVQDELAQETFTGGGVKVVSDRRGDVIYITAPNSGKTYMYQEISTVDNQGNITSERLWQPPQVWNISRVDSISGRVIAFSNSNPQFYYLWETNQWHDDAPDESVPYNCIMLLAYQGSRRQGKVVFEKIFYEGYITQGTALYGGIYYDYQGYTALLSPIINTTDNLLPIFFTGLVPPSLGDASLGDNPLGDGLNTQADDQQSLPKYKVIVGVEPKDCFEFALMMYSNSLDARWECLCLGTNQRLSVSEAVEIVKS